MLFLPKTSVVVEACVERTTCRASGGPLEDLLDLGDLHLSTFLASDDPVPPRYPLRLAWNAESGLVQLRHSVAPDLMYRRYWYRSGTNEAMRRHLAGIATDLTTRLQLGRDDIVLDIGCNDGTLLQAYPDFVYKVGYDPAEILPSGVDCFVNDYFTAESYDFRPARAVTSIAMFYDLEDPVQFAREVASVLAEDGLWVIEMHYLPAMLAQGSVDAICHEHLCYYSLTSLEYVLQQAGLMVVDVSQNTVNGGSFRAYVQKQGRPTRAVLAMRTAEQHLDFAAFVRDVRINRARTRQLLGVLRAQGKRVLGYGASTKGNTLLQYYGLGPDLLPLIAERSPDKWGRRTVGSNIPIVSEEVARRLRPDYFLVLPYHFIDTFVVREAAFVARGGSFIVPVPAPHLVPRRRAA